MRIAVTISSSGTSRNDGSNAPLTADRVLAEVDDLGEQRVVGPDPQAGLALEPRQLGAHQVAPGVGIDDDVGGAQRVDVAVGRSRSRRRRLARKRWPRLCRPAVAPAQVTGTTSPPNSATSHCTGRTNAVSLQPQRCDFGHAIAPASSTSSSGRSARASWPATLRIATA